MSVVGRGRLRKSLEFGSATTAAIFLRSEALSHELSETLRQYCFETKRRIRGRRSSPSIDVAPGQHRDTAWRRCRTGSTIHAGVRVGPNASIVDVEDWNPRRQREIEARRELTTSF